ncbi:hypothetical protein HBN50_09385 [Halobacteriovorax sp. GB3]|uniref:hypothetical protein n=1 Tax=Halobacteriovorax sp. GB3 TaxID=2719615 RepID=UPI00235EE3C5|nr:hypothetical protein [Halobacteriovorax sp. GB3]MDD0853311.1 hypothetical protein [Halobacteriovorax sp. GB3]
MHLKKVLFASCLMSALAFSVAAKEEKMTFDQKKEKAMSRLDKHIKMLSELKSCIQGAKDKSAMKACRKSHKSQMKEMRKSSGGGKRHRQRNKQESDE